MHLTVMKSNRSNIIQKPESQESLLGYFWYNLAIFHCNIYNLSGKQVGFPTPEHFSWICQCNELEHICL